MAGLAITAVCAVSLRERRADIVNKNIVLETARAYFWTDAQLPEAEALSFVELVVRIRAVGSGARLSHAKETATRDTCASAPVNSCRLCLALWLKVLTARL